MATERVREYIPPATCPHPEGDLTTLPDGTEACVRCGYRRPEPKLPAGWAGTESWPESDKRFAAGDR